VHNAQISLSDFDSIAVTLIDETMELFLIVEEKCTSLDWFRSILLRIYVLLLENSFETFLCDHVIVLDVKFAESETVDVDLLLL
jgi:hypothetical protein